MRQPMFPSVWKCLNNKETYTHKKVYFKKYNENRSKIHHRKLFH